eukprot:377874-Rhodomonas_salina.2
MPDCLCCYALARLCPGLTSDMMPRIRYAVPGTDVEGVVLQIRYAVSGTDRKGVVLSPYAMSGTDLADARLRYPPMRALGGVRY